MRKLLICFILLCAQHTLLAQQDKAEKNEVIEKRIELIAENLESENLDFTTLFDNLSMYFDHPLNLNLATNEELRELQLLTEYQINSIISYRVKYGNFQTIYELRNIPALDMESIQNILPFVAAESSDKVKLNALTDGHHDVFMRYSQVLEEKKGYTDEASSPYAGDPYSAYLRYRYQFANNLSIGFTADKDAGEDFFGGTNDLGFDFYSAHLYYHGNGVIDQLAVGDYQAQFGQGLVFWSGLSFGKSSDVLNIQRFGQKIKPYSSANENTFLRGGATTIELGKFKLTGFFSKKNIDANTVTTIDSLGNEESYYTAFQQTGLHRTESEIEDKNSIDETIYGGHLSYANEYFELGATAVKSEYGLDANRNLPLYNQFDFNAKSNINYGLDLNAHYSVFNVFGEIGQSENGAMAYVVGVNAALHSRFQLTVFNRSFDRDYQAMYGGAFSESSRNQNEKGTYFGATAKVSSTVTMSGYVDRYRFEWLKYLIDAPSEGGDVLLQINWRPSRRVEGYVRYRNEKQKRNSQLEDQTMSKIEDEDNSKYRIHIDYRVSESLRLKNRVEFSSYKLENSPRSNGILIYQDIQYHKPDGWLTLSGRFAVFETDDYNSRIYAYENDVLYYFSVPAYYGRGIKTYLTAKFDIGRRVDLWLRIARTYYTDRDEIGSGNELISEPTKTEVRAQVRFRF